MFYFFKKMKEFSFIISRKDNKSIEETYTIDELKQKIVIHNESNRKYIVFDNFDELDTFYEACDEKYYHEVIFGNIPQKVKFDLDINKNFDIINKYFEDDNIADNVIKIVDMVVDALVDLLDVSFNDIVITSSNGNGKYSYHIILIHYAVFDNEEAQKITEKIIGYIPEELQFVIDRQVNKRIQNFRLLNSTKVGQQRYKTLLNDIEFSFKDTLISITEGCKMFDKTVTKKKIKPIKENDIELIVNDKVIDIVLKSCEKITKGFKYIGVRKGVLCFRRIEPTFCVFCKEIHHNDNSLMISMCKKNSDYVSLYMHCRQVKGEKIFVGDVKIDDADVNYGRVNICGYIKSINEKIIDTNEEILFEKLEKKNVYESSCMMEYEHVPTLAVKAQMKLGKTKALKSYIDKYFNSGIYKNIIRFVTFRQTFSNAIKKDFEDFVLYSDVIGELDDSHSKLIIQVESLHRLTNNLEEIDLLILDEIESILSQFSSGLHKNFNCAFAQFKWMLSKAKYVVCMDANLSDRTYNTLCRLRGGEIFFHWNKWKRAKDDTYYITDKSDVWFNKLIEYLDEDNKIVIPINSLTMAKTFEELLKEKYPKKQIKLYSSETKQSEKKYDFNNVDESWSSLDVLMYTPTCSAGVSFEMEHFDKLFSYMTDKSCDVETCRQMLGRVRNLTDSEYFICFDNGTGLNLPTNVSDIRRHIYNKRYDMYKKIDDDHIQWNYDELGNVSFYESDYFHLWLETTRIRNLSRNSFPTRFMNQINNTGATIRYLCNVDGEVTLDTISDCKKGLVAVKCDEIAKSDEITDEEAMVIRNNEDMETVDRYKYEKYCLRKFYSFNGEINGNFVETYINNRVKIMYKNLVKLCLFNDINKSIDELQKIEQDKYSSVMICSMDYVDLIYDKCVYTSACLKASLWLLNVCGFKHFISDDEVSVEWLIVNLRKNVSYMNSRLQCLVVDYEINKPCFTTPDDKKFLGSMVRFINKIITLSFSVKLKKKISVYTLCNLGLFTFDKSNIYKVYIPNSLK